MKEFEKALPAGFYKISNQRVIIMFIYCKHIKLADTRLYDIEVIYARAMSLQCILQDYDKENYCFISSQPTSKFEDKRGIIKPEEFSQSQDVRKTLQCWCSIP